ncbi:hypothetical protein, conserved [Eimeria brunetti]|uniref:Uncharacterized protein n=1 Tax=Eimeria brunetti TaxID=51314 RepID=U6LAG7_9EIME|nr:hypothetical protein, conserved [Eimeria brunetti]
MSRKMPLAGSTDVSKVRGFTRGFTGSSACFPGGYDEVAESSETQVTPEPTSQQQEVAALEIIPPAICNQEDSLPLVCEPAAPEQLHPAAVLPEGEGFEPGTTTHVSEQDVCETVIHEPTLFTSREPLPMVQEEEVVKARTVLSAVPKKSFAVIVKQLLAFGIFSPTAAAALGEAIASIVEVEARSTGTAACGDPPASFARGPSAAAVAKILRQNISRCHPMCHTVRSILKSRPTADSSSSSSSEDDESSLPAYRTLSVQRRSCMRRRKYFRFFRLAKPRVYWAPNAHEAVYVEYIAPVASLSPPETVEVRAPSVDEPYNQFKLASKEAAAARAAAAAKAAAEGDPERQAAAHAAAVVAAALAREAAQEAAEAAVAEAKATAEQEARALALLRKVAAVLADAEGRTLQAKARAGLLSKEEFLRWQRRGEENL